MTFVANSFNSKKKLCATIIRNQKKKIISPLPKMLKQKQKNTGALSPSGQDHTTKSTKEILQKRTQNLVKFTVLNETRKQLRDKQNLRYDRRVLQVK